MRRDALDSARKIALTCMVLVAMSIIYVAVRGEEFMAEQASADTPTRVITIVRHPLTLPVPADRPAIRPTPAPAAPLARPTGPHQIQIGLIAGHYQNDSGAICTDGVREVDINLTVAERVAARLKRKGYSVDLLGEFDDRLNGYQGDVVLSLHSDSCDVFGMSGFKVARSEDSAIPAIEDKLVSCLSDSYAAATQLSFQENTITNDMRDYHAFRDVNASTPSAIIELGFMSTDRDALLYRQDRLAKGIVDGIQCFLDSRPQQ
jgi:N-acetylmuramoyl-L-alanine amidase